MMSMLKQTENQRAIDGRVLAHTPKAVRKIQRLTKWQIWKVQSQTDKDVLYTVLEKDNGDLECDCPDFDYRRVMCKHIYAVFFSEINVITSKVKPERIDISGADFD